ncbi:MAG TPA: NAD-glutamate dehydrogenase, partial [Mycobacterium sp.]|nr:NAD-glutamate dehydrogenase [Mycobacterium sp.]
MNAAMGTAYLATYRGPHGGAPHTDAADTGPLEQVTAEFVVPPGLIAAQERLAHGRAPGETLVAVYGSDDPGGFGPALQIVTDQATMLLDSVTVLLHRLAVAYVALMNPVFRVRRSASGELLDVRPAAAEAGDDGFEESWIHVQLSPSVNRKALAEAQRLLPMVVADARQVALDSGQLSEVLQNLARELDADTGVRFAGPDRQDVADLLRWLADGHFVLLGSQLCAVSDGTATVEDNTRLGVAKLRTEVLPELTEPGDLLVLAQATMPSFLRYGAYPYIVVVRESRPSGGLGVPPGRRRGGERSDSGKGTGDVEHRFVGLFTVAATSANVLDIPLISRRAREVLAMAQDDPSHPGQLMLDILQTIPRSELFSLTAEQMFAMATAVVDLGARRRALLFLRADQLGHFVSCLVYLPRDRYTTGVRLAMQDILVREFGGLSIDYTARVSESPWAVVHFTVRLPDSSTRQSIDTTEANRTRVQGLLTEALRTWGDRLIGAAGTGSIDQAMAEHYADALPEEYKQVVNPIEAITDIGFIEGLQENSVRLQFEPGDDESRDAFLTWYLGGSTASLSHLLPMLQCMGVLVLEERPFTVVRPDGLKVWIYQFKIRPDDSMPDAETQEE